MSFGSVIPVTGLMTGFVGQVSRIEDAIITARPVLATTPNPIPFGAPMVIVPTVGGGDSFQSVADYIAGGGTFTAAKLAAIAIREVKTNLQSFLSIGNNSPQSIGSYQPGEICEGLERSSITVLINNGVPVSQAPVFVRIAQSAGIPAGVVGGFEAVIDPVTPANTIVVPNLVFRTGKSDQGLNNVYEVTLLSRVAA